ncbi:hypothetical protein HII31_03579, partial [Pseudocercospora fuligena]
LRYLAHLELGPVNGCYCQLTALLYRCSARGRTTYSNGCSVVRRIACYCCANSSIHWRESILILRFTLSRPLARVHLQRDFCQNSPSFFQLRHRQPRDNTQPPSCIRELRHLFLLASAQTAKHSPLLLDTPALEHTSLRQIPQTGLHSTLSSSLKPDST